MVESTEEKVISEIKRLIRQHTYCSYRDEEECFVTEIYADYRDEARTDTIIQWCRAENPWDAFWESLDEWYRESVWDEEDNIIAAVRKNWCSKCHSYEENEEFIEEWIRENLSVELPSDHYLEQEVCVDIIVDTGDGNYDYVLNDVYPHYDGRYEERIPEEASILWLARQQGYLKKQLSMAMKKQIFGDSKLLESLRTEVLNCSSHMNALTFFVKMTVKELFKLQEAIAESEKDEIKTGKYSAVQKRKHLRHMVLSKDTACGLYDNWSGAGSVLEIELEKDVVLPLKFISSAWPDGGRGYSVANIYGICSSFWTDTVKQIA